MDAYDNGDITLGEKSRAGFEEPRILYEQLINTIKGYHPSTDLSLIERAYTIAYDAHKDQKRKSGEPYIIHPLHVAIILAQLESDKETIIAGILHDVLEDTDMTDEELKKTFGEEVTSLVDGVTKLDQLKYISDKLEVQAENLRKMFLAMAKDIRVVLIKLADRLHNMRTMQYQPSNRQLEISRETLDIYAPIGQHLGISFIKKELDDLALKYLEPEAYNDLKQKIVMKKEERERFISEVISDIRDRINENETEVIATIDGRIKHFFSIYKKMLNQDKTFDQVHDLFAIRIIVNTVKDCYVVLGILHDMYKPIPGRFKDYVAMPKQNMYQSLHTTVIGPNGRPFEIQIRTWEMHKTAEFGIAAHWKYKESSDGRPSSDDEQEKMTWLKKVLEWQQDISDNKEFMNLLKDDFNLFSDSVYCFTPNGDVKALPLGSTPIDFAYSIHSAIGNRMVGARVNKKMVPFEYHLQNGDQVEIIVSNNSKGPSKDWLKVVKSTQAKSKINQWFKNEFKEDNIQRGKEMLAEYAKQKNITLSELMKKGYMEPCIQKYGHKDIESIYAAIGRGALKESQVVNCLQDEYNKQNKKNVTDEQVLNELTEYKSGKDLLIKAKNGILIQGASDLATHYSKCCSPVPGDEIVGFITRGRGVSIHRTDCVNVINMPEDERERLVPVEWSAIEKVPEEDKSYVAELKIYANNRMGLMVDISRTFSENKIDINAISSRVNKQNVATFIISFWINGVDQLQFIRAKLMNVESVMDIERTTG